MDNPLAHGPAALPVAILIGVCNFASIFAVWRALSPTDTLAAKARSHARRRQELRSNLLQRGQPARRRPISLARRLVEALKVGRGGEAKKAADRLVQAGWRSPDATTWLLAGRLASPLTLCIIAYLVPPLVVTMTPLARILAAAAGTGLGAWLPTLLLNNAIAKRRHKIQRGLPDALDLFVICAEAGLSLDAAVTRVGKEIGASSPELADELLLTAIELGFLPNRRDALQNLMRRVDTPQIRGLVATLIQTERYGTPLAQSLRVLASEYRDTAMMKAEEKAARLPALLTIPMIVFILPPLFIVLIGPAIVQVLNTKFG